MFHQTNRDKIIKTKQLMNLPMNIPAIWVKLILQMQYKRLRTEITKKAMKLMFLFQSKHLNIFQKQVEINSSRNPPNPKKPVLFHHLKFIILTEKQRAWLCFHSFQKTLVIRAFSRKKEISKYRYQRTLF